MPQGRQRKRKTRGGRFRNINIKSVDLFCGAGGLTRGLEAAGIDVVFGVDIDPECEYPYATNNKASFTLKPIEALTRKDFKEAFKGPAYTLLAGCAPCQPFSTYQRERMHASDQRWQLLRHFGRLIKEVEPDLVTMENAPGLQTENVFVEFYSLLEDDGRIGTSGLSYWAAIAGKTMIAVTAPTAKATSRADISPILLCCALVLIRAPIKNDDRSDADLCIMLVPILKRLNLLFGDNDLF